MYRIVTTNAPNVSLITVRATTDIFVLFILALLWRPSWIGFIQVTRTERETERQRSKSAIALSLQLRTINSQNVLFSGFSFNFSQTGFAKEWSCSFLFVVCENAPTFPALLQFSLNTDIIGLISYLRPGCERRGGGGGRGNRKAVAGAKIKGDPAGNMHAWEATV